MKLAVAVALALAAAASFAISSALQQGEARKAPPNESLSWRLIADLLRRKNWLAGLGCVVLGFGLQAVALDLAPIALVEPILATELLFAIPLARHLHHHRRMGRREWIGAAAVAGGVALFLTISSPKGGNPEPGMLKWSTMCLPVIILAGCAIAIARGPETPRRATLLAGAAGLIFAVQALMTQSLVVLWERGFVHALSSWQPYALAVVGAVGFTVAQSAYQSGPLSLSLPIIDALEPSGSVILASLTFGQALSLSDEGLGLECLGALVALIGIVLLGRSPVVLGIYQEEENLKSDDAPRLSGRAAYGQ